MIMFFQLNKDYLIFMNMDLFYYHKSMIKQFLKSVAAVNPAKLVSENLKSEKGKLYISNKVYDIADKNVHLIGFGKAVLGMAAQCERILGQHLKSGVICCPVNMQQVFKDNRNFNLKENSVIKIFEGAENNLPDQNAVKGTTEIISLVKALDCTKDHLIVLISGGGSALFTKPKPSISLAEKIETVKLLMESGADIKELNTVRRKLSLVKGGRFACLFYPVKTTCLIISDVIEDPLEIIASGPTVPCFDPELAALSIMQKYNLENKIPNNVLIETKKISQESDIPIENFKFPHVDNFIIGHNSKALNASKIYAQKLGFDSIILSNKVSGSIQRMTNFYANMIFEILTALYNGQVSLHEDLFKDCCFDVDHKIFEEINNLIKKPNDEKKICITAGGETTAEVKGKGKGGRNQELALRTSVKVYDLKIKSPHLFTKHDVLFLFAGTDGIDGPTDAAGAVGGSHIVEEAVKCNLNIDEYLFRSDSYNFFSHINNGSWLIKTGHTGTNVMDIHIILIYQKSSFK